MPLGRIEHFLVLTDDIDATRAWYERVLGLTAGDRPPLEFPGHWLYADRVPVVHIGDRSAYEAHSERIGVGSSAAAAGTGPVDHIAFSATDYDELKARFAENGVSAAENEIPGLMRQLFITDPNGVRLEINVRD